MRFIENVFDLLLYLLCIVVFAIPYGVMSLCGKLEEN